MTASHWWKECIYIVDYRARALATDGPVLVVLIYNEYEWLEFVKRTVSKGTLAFSAVHASQLLWSSSTTLNGSVDVVIRFEHVQFQ